MLYGTPRSPFHIGLLLAAFLLAMADAPNSASEREKLPAYTNHDGFLLPVGFPTESFDSALKYEPQENGE